MEGIRIEVTDDVDPTQILRLMRSANWVEAGEEVNLEIVRQAWKQSTCVVLAFDDDTLVGMGRALGDGCTQCYLHEITVTPSHRGRGIGRGIVERLVEVLQARGIRWIGLIAEPGVDAWYRSMGFRIMSGHVPLVLEGGGDEQNRGSMFGAP